MLQEVFYLALTHQIEKLKQAKGDKFLTIYLDTDRSKPSQQRDEWKVRLKNGLKKLQEYCSRNGESEVYEKQLNALCKKVRQAIHEKQPEHKKGLVLIASNDGTLWEMQFLHLNVSNQFHWEDKPQLGQLETLNKKHPRSAIVMGRKDEVRVLEVALGQVVDEFAYKWEIDQDNWRIQQVPTPVGNEERQSAYGKDHIDKKREQVTLKQFKQLCPQLQKEVKKRQCKGVYLVGDPAIMDQLKEAFKPLPIIKEIPKNIKPEMNQHHLAKVI